MKALITAGLMILVLISCKETMINTPNCNGSDNIDLVQYDFFCQNLDQSEFLIKDEKSYQAILNNCMMISNINLVVDFNDYDLVGLRASGSGCNRTFTSLLESCDAEEKYYYTVIINEVGSCEPLETRTVFSRVPKLNEDWDIAYNVIVNNL